MNSSLNDKPDKSIEPLVEFAVNINESDDIRRIEQALSSKGTKIVASNLQEKTIQVELGFKTSPELADVQSLQRFIERQTGIITVFKGLGHITSAVVELRPPSEIRQANSNVMGVVRLSQILDNQCLVDGLIDGFDSGRERVSVSIHEFGDLSSDNFDSIGRPVKDILVDEPISDTKSLSFRRVIPECNVKSEIGKSLAVTDLDTILGAGVIARSSTIDANKKQYCSCSGKTLWEERLDKIK